MRHFDEAFERCLGLTSIEWIILMMIFKTCENFCKADKDSGAENNYAKFVEETFNIVVVVG